MDIKSEKVFNKIIDKIDEDFVEASYVTTAGSFLLVATVGCLVYCYKMPYYEQKFVLDLKIDNRQVKRVMRAFKDQGVSYDVDVANAIFDRNGITCIAADNDAKLVAVGYVHGFLHVYDTTSRNVLHIIQGHVDVVVCHDKDIGVDIHKERHAGKRWH